jgi:predicted nuclease with TOPRIM domain
MQTLNSTLADSRYGDVGSDVSERDMIRRKLPELQAEFERGQQQLTVLDQSRSTLRDTLLRISGAIQVLKELLQEQEGNGADGEALPDDRAKRAEPVTTSEV